MFVVIKSAIYAVMIMVSFPLFANDRGSLYYTQGWELKRYDSETEEVSVLYGLSPALQKKRRNFFGGMAYVGNGRLVVEGLVEDYKLYLYDLSTGAFRELTQGVAPTLVDNDRGVIYYWGVYEKKNTLLSISVDDLEHDSSAIMDVDSLPRGDLLRINGNDFVYVEGKSIKGGISGGVYVGKSIPLSCAPLFSVNKGRHVLCKKRDDGFYLMDSQSYKLVNKLVIEEGFVHPVIYLEDSNQVIFRRDFNGRGGKDSDLLFYDLDADSYKVSGLNVNARLGASVYIRALSLH